MLLTDIVSIPAVVVSNLSCCQCEMLLWWQSRSM